MKLDDVIKYYNLPIVCENKQQLLEIIHENIEKSKKTPYPVEWWVLKFIHGKCFVYNPAIHNWEVVEDV